VLCVANWPAALVAGFLFATRIFMRQTETRTAANDRPHDCILFVSSCPRCSREQAQSYGRADLRRLISRAHPIEGYCVMCDGYWSLSVPERASLMAELAPS